MQTPRRRGCGGAEQATKESQTIRRLTARGAYFRLVAYQSPDRRSPWRTLYTGS